MASHKTDWFPGRVSDDYRDNFEKMEWSKDSGICKECRTWPCKCNRMEQYAAVENA